MKRAEKRKWEEGGVVTWKDECCNYHWKGWKRVVTFLKWMRYLASRATSSMRLTSLHVSVYGHTCFNVQYVCSVFLSIWFFEVVFLPVLVNLKPMGNCNDKYKPSLSSWFVRSTTEECISELRSQTSSRCRYQSIFISSNKRFHDAHRANSYKVGYFGDFSSNGSTCWKWLECLVL